MNQCTQKQPNGVRDYFPRKNGRQNWIGTDEAYDPRKDLTKYMIRGSGNFRFKGKPSKATLFVASVGYHEVYVNGKRIDDHVLAPAVTDHTKRARYIAYDIAPHLHPAQTSSPMAGTSWSIFAPYATADKPRTPLVIAQTDIYDANDRKLARIATDQSWKTYPSPNKLIGNWGFGVGGYGGEIWDASKEVEEWNLATLDDRN